nr:reverse transcriptase domain, reverse transcriptase zinc-binding domain protein [Tanacetum cinerariifolium]
ELPCRGNMSWEWMKVLLLRPLIQKFIWHKVGDGSHVSIRFDQWCNLSPFANFVSSRYMYRVGLAANSMVSAIFHDGTLIWPQDRRSSRSVIAKLVVASSAYFIWQERNGQLFKKSKRLVQRGLHAQVRTVQTDKGTEFLNKTLHAYFATERIEHQTLSPVPQSQENVPQAAGTVTTSNKLDLQFSLMFDELLNESTQVVPKSFVVTSADAPNQFKDDEFINIFYTPVQEREEPSSRHVDSSNMHTFYQRHPSEHRWTKDHLLEQVIGNPSQSVRTRHQLESGSEMYMFALTVSRTELKNIKEAMADSVWIESMQEELHQFDRLDSSEGRSVCKPARWIC